MPQLRRVFSRLALTLAGTLLSAAAAHALPQTFVSSLGNDANTCAQTSPCRTFAGALTKTDAKGEITVLDAGEYGAVVIDKSVRITAVGVYAGILTTGAAITVSAASTDVVALRGLTLTGMNGTVGIDFTSGGTLHVEGCAITGFNQKGIFFEAAGQLFVKDTSVRNIVNSGIGIFVNPASGSATASIDHCRVERHTVGIAVSTLSPATAEATIRNSVAAANFNSGFLTLGGAQVTIEDSFSFGNDRGFSAAQGAKMSLRNCTSSSNGTGASVNNDATMTIENCQLLNSFGAGLNAFSFATAIISDSVVTGNGTGISSSSSTIKSFGNNRVNGNGTNVSGPITPVSQL